MIDIKKELLGVIGEAYGNRLMPRLEGLTDDEYFWEPVPDCWTVRRNDDGTYRADWGYVVDEIPPFTTIAWRMRHLIDCYGGPRTASWLGLEPKTSPLDREGTPGTASDAVRMLNEAHDILIAYISAVDEEVLSTKIGPMAGIYAENTKLSLLIHLIDEVIHHGAEIALLRDLYRAQHRKEDPFVLACLQADRAAVDAMRKEDAGIVQKMIEAHPHLMLRAAEIGRYEAIPLLVDLGFPVDGPNGRGPIHHTAGAGKVEITRLLVDGGADLDAKDPVWDSTPLGWAEYFNAEQTVSLLRDVTTSART